MGKVKRMIVHFYNPVLGSMVRAQLLEVGKEKCIVKTGQSEIYSIDNSSIKSIEGEPKKYE